MHYQALCISDTHIGSKKSIAEKLYWFLKNNTYDALYIVGDFVDIWRFKQAFRMSKDNKIWHLRIIQLLLKRSNKGTEIYYVWGNHDELLELFKDSGSFGNIHLSEKAEYTDSTGIKYQVIHGHQYDLITKYKGLKWLGKFGDFLYDIMILVNRWQNKFRRMFGLRYWSLSKYLKLKVKSALNFTNNFKDIATQRAKHDGYDGVITGHIHDPELSTLNGVLYANCGCWTDEENLSYLYDTGSGLRLGYCTS